MVSLKRLHAVLLIPKRVTELLFDVVSDLLDPVKTVSQESILSTGGTIALALGDLLTKIYGSVVTVIFIKVATRITLLQALYRVNWSALIWQDCVYFVTWESNTKDLRSSSIRGTSADFSTFECWALPKARSSNFFPAQMSLCRIWWRGTLLNLKTQLCILNSIAPSSSNATIFQINIFTKYFLSLVLFTLFSCEFSNRVLNTVHKTHNVPWSDVMQNK